MQLLAGTHSELPREAQLHLTSIEDPPLSDTSIHAIWYVYSFSSPHFIQLNMALLQQS